ncbi:Crp/Fnr family transcriptional regulator [Adhaeribacter pallidiroseus]|uniref:Non-specific serine/threonine protein kinase n=1 Tax=Adhaeribacter pallidiroseus TaxID=2072847 RepID=A0A369QB17_9BACT|nr:Crp/Fnr family transcriptional regulator [Adhaeribacter pallidiroseus]RDC62111.1 Non-specific serine/threonine protein kinase [Adhaeribacter pallidiroseus]
MHPALCKFLEGKINLSAAHQELINRCFQPKSTKRHEILVPKGAIAKHVYFVVKGCLRVFLTGTDGSESTRFLVFEGRMGTAFPSFILQQPSVATVESLEPSELLALNFPDRQMLFQAVPGWETMNRIGIERDYIASIQRIESFITLDAQARYQDLLRSHPDMIKRLPAKIVADYLGISPETLSRLKAKK